jgi:hypothetical protein
LPRALLKKIETTMTVETHRSESNQSVMKRSGVSHVRNLSGRIGCSTRSHRCDALRCQRRGCRQFPSRLPGRSARATYLTQEGFDVLAALGDADRRREDWEAA